MAPLLLHVLTETEKNDLLLAQYEMIERLAARISELEALVGKPRKTSKNSHIPPSKDSFGKGGGNGRTSRSGKRPARKGKHRPIRPAKHAKTWPPMLDMPDCRFPIGT
jgi:transposase